MTRLFALEPDSSQAIVLTGAGLTWRYQGFFFEELEQHPIASIVNLEQCLSGNGVEEEFADYVISPCD